MFVSYACDHLYCDQYSTCCKHLFLGLTLNRTHNKTILILLLKGSSRMAPLWTLWQTNHATTRYKLQLQSLSSPRVPSLLNGDLDNILLLWWGFCLGLAAAIDLKLLMISVTGSAIKEYVSAFSFGGMCFIFVCLSYVRRGSMESNTISGRNYRERVKWDYWPKINFSKITFLMLTHMYFDCAISKK